MGTARGSSTSVRSYVRTGMLGARLGNIFNVLFCSWELLLLLARAQGKKGGGGETHDNVWGFVLLFFLTYYAVRRIGLCYGGVFLSLFLACNSMMGRFRRIR